jgi:hypothetical protein
VLNNIEETEHTPNHLVSSVSNMQPPIPYGSCILFLLLFPRVQCDDQKVLVWITLMSQGWHPGAEQLLARKMVFSAQMPDTAMVELDLWLPGPVLGMMGRSLGCPTASWITNVASNMWLSLLSQRWFFVSLSSYWLHLNFWIPLFFVCCINPLAW